MNHYNCSEKRLFQSQCEQVYIKHATRVQHHQASFNLTEHEATASHEKISSSEQKY